MFHHPAGAIRSYASGPPAAGTVGTKSTGGFHHSCVSPCRHHQVLLPLDALPEEGPGSVVEVELLEEPLELLVVPLAQVLQQHSPVG